MKDLPITCTLDSTALDARREHLLGGLISCVLERIEIPDGCRVRFQSDDGVLTRIASVVETERRCCKFLTFRLTAEPDDGAIWLEVSGPPGTREFLRAAFNF